MRIGIGTTNSVKINALSNLAARRPVLADSEIVSVEASSGVSDQPFELIEIIKGAESRAKQAFVGNDLGVGIESGLVQLPEHRYLNVCACVIYDGKGSHVGLSQAFELPPAVANLVRNKNLELRDAFVQSGIGGEQTGVIEFLTHGRVNRTQYTEDAIGMALIHLEHPAHY